MRHTLFFLSHIFLWIFSLSFFTAKATFAQIVPDNTLNTQVDSNGNISEITGGQTQGNNLFHSFQDFSVQNGNEAFFNNANNITNIFSRVTGENISTIDGLIRNNGSASLFLINPNGIIFGEEARLNIGGSFLGSTASSILFDGGEFSATDLDNPPLLTINAPIGLGLEDNPGEIVNRSTVQNSEGIIVGLEVLKGNNLSLVGGKIEFEGGKVNASRGNVELGGLSTAGTIRISEDGGLTFPDDIAKADVTLSNDSVIDVSGGGKGDITINARNFNLTESSFLIAGIREDLTSNDAQAGDIEINLTNNLTIDDSRILNIVQPNGIGNAGKIKITTGSIDATNGGQFDATTSGQGNAGNITIKVAEDITFDGEDSNNLDSSAIAIVNENAVGNAGNITISTGDNLTLTRGGRVDASSNGQGNAGNIAIDVIGDLTIDGEDSEQLGSGVTSLVNPKAVGDSGDITILTGGNLTLTDRGRVDGSNNGQGNAGNIAIDVGGNLTIDGPKNDKGFSSSVASRVQGGAGDSGDIIVLTGGNLTLQDEVLIDASNNSQGDTGNITVLTEGNLTLIDGGQINTNVNGRGNGGNIIINAKGDIAFEGEDSKGEGSGVTSLIGQGVEGDAGDIMISTAGKLSLTDGGRIDASTNQGRGNAGAVRITAIGDIVFEGESSGEFGNSGATSQVNPGVEAGNSGGVTISTQGQLTLKDGGRVDASTNAQGDAGLVNLTALGDITFEGKNLKGEGSGATSQVNSEVAGNAGTITISTQRNLNLRDGGRVDVSINAQQEGGNLAITDSDRANIILQVAENIFLDSNGLISAKALGNADGGNININTEFIVAVPNINSDIIANAEQGRGGNIEINTQAIFGIEERSSTPPNETNDIDASSQFGFSGTVEINILEVNPSQSSLEIPLEPIRAEVSQTCNRNTSGDRSEFVVTGSGGLPTDPEDNFRVPAIANGANVFESKPSTQQSEVSQPVVEATKWVRNAEGKILLLASSTQKTTPNSYPHPSNCQDKLSQAK